MRLPSRMGTMTLRSMMARDSSSVSVALRFAMAAVSGVRACAWADGMPPAKIVLHKTARQADFASRFIRASLVYGCGFMAAELDRHYNLMTLKRALVSVF